MGIPTVPKPIAFFDRDGTLIEDQCYHFDLSRLAWMPGAFEALRHLRAAGWRSVVVTNQSAVARGYSSEAEVERFNHEMVKEAAQTGAFIDVIEYCPYMAEAPVLRYRRHNHPDRKPNPGMILKHLPADPKTRSRSFLIGDKRSDIRAVTAAGITGHLYTPGDDLMRSVRQAIAQVSAKSDDG
ncbi:HAD-IIIA family hydrolase [Rhodophyticola sp. CCM32]|uniref:D-glycero-alpha-D-manno-heptose-1,7-bisphosphate 7-phosphatase n=1 Tax=Rhodophyticola sp. CCM32 TaxID=2916397 RepID=UPI00107FB8FB|nr:HAD-IIIA family hydrolase [Rhodophyticola sp. CCM32]QBY00380.1 HAD-IIIA family hydrolase [Rhodophyticola sp. CCM32]